MEERKYASNRAWQDTIPEGGYRYSVSFEDFGDETFAKAVAEEIKAVVVVFSKHLAVSFLDGFTFANDYKAALNNLERGFHVNKEITPTETEGRVSLGMPLTIVADGKIKTRVVLRSHVAADLVSENEEIARNARSVILYMLASGALTGLIANKFPQQILSPVSHPYEELLFTYTTGVFEAYFCSSVSTWSDKQVEDYERMVLLVLKDVFAQIPENREAYRHGGDLEEFFDTSARKIAEVLITLARVFGAYKARGRALAEDSCVVRFLEEHNLNRWASLFWNDLEGFDAGLEEWADYTEIFFVHRHFERLMAYFGIVPDRTDGPGAYVHVL